METVYVTAEERAMLNYMAEIARRVPFSVDIGKLRFMQWLFVNERIGGREDGERG